MFGDIIKWEGEHPIHNTIDVLNIRALMNIIAIGFFLS
jgi:hypothetical protein